MQWERLDNSQSDVPMQQYFVHFRLNPNSIMLLVRKPQAHNICELQEIMLGTCNTHNSTCHMVPVGYEDELT